MPPLSDISATRRSQAFKFLGSFWNRTFSQKDKVRLLVELDHQTNVLDNLQASIANMAGDTEKGRGVSFVEVSFRFEDVVETGMLTYDDASGFLYQEPEDTLVAYNNYRIRYFALELQDILPLSIQSTAGLLMLGIDFFIQANRWIYFRDDPRILFPGGIYVISKGWRINYRSYLTFLTKTHAPGYDDIIVNWMRKSQTPSAFKLALAACGKLGIIRQGGVLRSVTQTADGVTIYVFDTESVRVNYEHNQLIQGKTYTAGSVIGDVIQIYQADDRQAAWWRQVDWRGGLILDPILPGFKNLPLADVKTVAYVAGQDIGSINGSRSHVRLALTSDYASELPYWEWVARQETLQRVYINNAIGLPDEVVDSTSVDNSYDKLISGLVADNVISQRAGLPAEEPDFSVLPASIPVNALDTFFQVLLARSSFVITFDASKMLYQSEVYAFLKREMPVGSTNIIFGYMSHNPVEPVVWGKSVLVRERVHIEALQTSTLSESIGLSGAVKDFVTLTPIYGVN